MRTVEPGMEIMLETFIHETETMLEQLDEILLESEKAKSLSEEYIGNIFRITHTIKGSAAMMDFTAISKLSHSIEDVFYIIREDPAKLDMVFDSLFDLILTSSDVLKEELEKIQSNDEYEEPDVSEIIDSLHDMAKELSGKAVAKKEETVDEVVEVTSSEGGMYKIVVHFTDDCQMENMRAFMLLTQLQHVCSKLESIPENPENDLALSEDIVRDGFIIFCKPLKSIDDVEKTIEGAMNIKSYEIMEPEAEPEDEPELESVVEKENEVVVDEPKKAAPKKAATTAAPAAAKPAAAAKQSLISVNQSKLDQLMDLVGELVTAESMVIRNPDLKGLKLDNFTKSIRELKKLTDELQDIVMSMRMVPLSGTFLKMERIVRDMSKKLDKKAELVTQGGETEIDKTINDAIVDPFMHMIRNSMDHAIETEEERIAAGKDPVGKVTLTAKNVGGEILIKISDDGKGLDPEKLLAKARDNGILTKPESEYTDKEIYSLILVAGFSTKTQVTEFSGRGVGMDVVRKNIEQVGGSISINSQLGEGTTFTMKIPLTLAIAEGMNFHVGDTTFTMPITSITQSFKVNSPSQIIQNTDGSEMIMIRGECYSILRLHRVFDIDTDITNIEDGILIQIETAENSTCVFADELLGEYQVVVKPFPPFFNQYELKEKGISGCSILGDGSISLILDANSLLNNL